MPTRGLYTVSTSCMQDGEEKKAGHILVICWFWWHSSWVPILKLSQLYRSFVQAGWTCMWSIHVLELTWLVCRGTKPVGGNFSLYKAAWQNNEGIKLEKSCLEEAVFVWCTVSHSVHFGYSKLGTVTSMSDLSFLVLGIWPAENRGFTMWRHAGRWGWRWSFPCTPCHDGLLLRLFQSHVHRWVCKAWPEDLLNSAEPFYCYQ